MATAAIAGPGNIGTDLLVKLQHTTESANLVRQARIMDDASASTSWTPPARCCPTEWPTASPSSWPNSLRRAGRGARAPNLSLGVANSIAGVKAGARQIDGTSCALGAVAGHSPTEILVVAFERLGVATRVDTDAVLASPRK